MQYRTPTYMNELRRSLSWVPFDFTEFRDKTFLIAGSTGMIGSALVDTLVYIRDTYKVNMKFYLLSRKIESLNNRFAYLADDDRVVFLEHDVREPFNEVINVDYIIHAASDANPIAYATKPVEVMQSNFLGMMNFLDLGIRSNNPRIMYVSSGEIYGQLDDNHDGFEENYSGFVDYSDSRSCYPSSKRAAEVLCQSYIKEYGSDVVIVRPCHIYGPTMTESDTRAATAFIRNVSEGKDIVLKSDGSARRTMCYVFDTVTAMLFALIRGENGSSYNISNMNCNVSIKEIAQIASNCGDSNLIFDIPNSIEAQGFNRVKNAILYSTKLEKLGWMPKTDLVNGIETTIKIIKERNSIND